MKQYSISVLVLLSAILSTFPALAAYVPPPDHPSRPSPGRTIASDTFAPAAHGTGAFVLEAHDGGVACREASSAEAEALARPVHSESVREISPAAPRNRFSGGDGLRLVLRGTRQLDAHPEAKAAYLRAAAVWERKIRTPITIVIDVDFGPTNFGTPYPPNALGASFAQELTAELYGEVRERLIEGAASEQARSIFASLPEGTVPTDLGRTATMRAPSANGRALGLFVPVADPDGTEASLGSPPTIALNSNVNYDYHPSGGIGAREVDFEAVVVHEIGHILGFLSSTGVRELDGREPVSVSVWDLFRLRPGTAESAFPRAERILLSGGEQTFAAAGLEIPLSTGRPDRTGGDGQQASHWKNDSYIDGRYIGVMEVSLPFGARQVLTSHDLVAIELMGYSLREGLDMAPELGTFAGHLKGGVLTVAGATVDVDGDADQLLLALLDESGTVLAEMPAVSLDGGNSRITRFAIRISEAEVPRTATRASLTVVDRAGNRGETFAAGILGGEPGGPVLSRVSFRADTLKIKGQRLAGEVQLEINGVINDALAVKPSASGKKLVVSASAAELGLDRGVNRVRVIRDGVDSNVLLLSY
jgi:hypothetical protein